MTITLQQFAQLDSNYIGKHNANASAIESAINALQSQVAAAMGTIITGASGEEAIFGAQNTLINEGSYLPTADGTDLDVAAGYFWNFSTGALCRKLTTTTIPFVGEPADTYYVVVDSTGEPTKSTSSTGACYSVVWTGSAFGTITRLVPIAWGFATFDAAKVSTALAATYQSLDARLEAGEAAPGVALAAHAAEADPHTGYQKESEKSAANGYASLDSGGKVPAAELPGSGPGSGTVTSVALTVPAELSVGGSPITTAGTLAVTKANQSANQVYAGPASGGAAAPVFRALVHSDLPHNLVIQQAVFGFTTAVATGDGAGYVVVPSALNGLNLVRVHARVITAGTTGTTDIQIHNVTQAADMLSTKITIDSGETGSDTAAAAAVIDTGNDDVATNDLLRIDIDAVSTTEPEGLIITLEFA